MNKTFVIKEMTIDWDDASGVQAISFVDQPAIETPFEYFADKSEFFEYTAAPDPEVIETSHRFCREHAGKIYHISQIHSWPTTGEGFIEGSNFFKEFKGNGNFNIDNQLYFCRHWLRRVPLAKVPKELQQQYMNKETFVTFSVDSFEKRIVKGLVLQSNQMIYRNNADAQGNPGYVYFSRNTVRQMKEKYGYNRRITFQHNEDITGSCILLDSFLEEDDSSNVTKWYLSYKVIDDKLWDVIKAKKVIGFSLEALLKIENKI